MFLNIMYYDLSTEAKTNNSTDSSLSLGSWHISAQQIIIGVIVELLALVPSLLLVHMFRRLRSRYSSVSPVRQAMYRIDPKRTITEQPQDCLDEKKKKRSKFTLPWWFIFIVYGLCLILVAVSTLFIIARGIEFGDVKTQQWLISIVSSFFSSVLLTQPIKVLSLAIIVTFFTRKKNDDPEAGEHLQMETFDLTKENHGKDRSLFTYRAPVHFDRLNEAQVAYARDQRLKELQMWSFLRKSFLCIGYLVILSMITFSNRDQTAFRQVQHLRKFVLNTRQIDHDFTKITTIHQYWSWLEGNFVSNLRAQPWYNEEVPRNLNGFINDKSNRMIGWAIMQQTRRRLLNDSKYKIDQYSEENRSFLPGWINETSRLFNSSIDRSFTYRQDKELDLAGYVYEFRGRLNDLQTNLSKLHQLRWIDNRTHIVKIQFNLYNPNAQLFTVVTLSAEVLLSGGIQTQMDFQPFNLFFEFTSTYQLICSIIYIGFILCIMFSQIQAFCHRKSAYFKQFWSYIELGILVCSWTSVGLYVWRYREAQRIGNLFNKTHGYVYFNLRLAVYVNDLLTFLLGFCCFFGTIRFLRLCRINPRLTLFSRTLKRASAELLSFSLMFSIVFVAFVSLFYLLFTSKISHCASLFQTAEMLFEMILMKFDASELINASAFLGPFSFALFIFLVVFVCMSMFLTILSDSFRHVRDAKYDDEEIIGFICDRFLRWTGLRKPTETERHEIWDAQMRQQYLDPIENFPHKIDQLLDALNRLYMTQITGRI